MRQRRRSGRQPGLAPDFQLIVSDHANLTDQWYQDCVRYNWRNGDALIPQDWIDEHAG
nr:DUF3732 domain-containing protein [Streptomyces caniscabiei]